MKTQEIEHKLRDSYKNEKFKYRFPLDSIGGFLDTINDFDNIKKTLWDRGEIQLIKENEEYFILYETYGMHLKIKIWRIIERNLERILNNAYYKRMRDKTLEIFKIRGASDLEIMELEYTLYANRFKFDDFYDFDFEKEDKKTTVDAINLNFYKTINPNFFRSRIFPLSKNQKKIQRS